MRYGFIKWDFKYKILIINIAAMIIAACVMFFNLTFKEQVITVFKLCVFIGILIIPSTYVLDKFYQEKKSKLKDKY